MSCVFPRGHDYLPVTHYSYSLSVDNEKKSMTYRISTRKRRKMRNS